ncbi:hypothetical protein C8Q74DRAFT_1305959 [Fomes fomentarius]|nr:hypothetical protein C8Q74DRAFT_1305959 [Fomes fomentarius]
MHNMHLVHTLSLLSYPVSKARCIRTMQAAVCTSDLQMPHCAPRSDPTWLLMYSALHQFHADMTAVCAIQLRRDLPDETLEGDSFDWRQHRRT